MENYRITKETIPVELSPDEFYVLTKWLNEECPESLTYPIPDAGEIAEDQMYLIFHGNRFLISQKLLNDGTEG